MDDEQPEKNMTAKYANDAKECYVKRCNRG